MQEFGFELELAAVLERSRESIVSRQLGTGIHGRRVMDIVCLEPGPEFEVRTQLTEQEIPALAIESDVGPGRSRYWKDVFDCHPEQAQAVIDQAVECGFFERERSNGRTYIRQTTRYPDWFDRIVGIENKPDLGEPGELETQLLTDVKLGLLDEIILVTASYVTGAHRNRIPDEVGIWRFHPETGEREVLREPAQLPTHEPGIELIDRSSARTQIQVATPAEIAAARRQLAERAYGKGWRSYEFPGCARIEPENGLPYCPWKDTLVRPAEECGPSCDGHVESAPPVVDIAAIRDRQTPWVRDPAGKTHRQVGFEHFAASEEEKQKGNR